MLGLQPAPGCSCSTAPARAITSTRAAPARPNALMVGPRAITASGGILTLGRWDMHHESLLVVSSRGELIGKVIHYDGDETFSVEGGTVFPRDFAFHYES